MTPWADLQQLSATGIEEIQEGLKKLGYDVAKIDGKAGMNTRSLVGAYQKANGLKVDCWPTEAVMNHVRAKAQAKTPPVKGADAGRDGSHAAAGKRAEAASHRCQSPFDGNGLRWSALRGNTRADPRTGAPCHHLNALPWQGECRMVRCSYWGALSAYRGHGVEARRAPGPPGSRQQSFGGRQGYARNRRSARAILMLLVFGLASPAAAQEGPTGTSYITPFPEGDIYKLQAYGDAFAEGLLGGLTEAFAGDTPPADVPQASPPGRPRARRVRRRNEGRGSHQARPCTSA